MTDMLKRGENLVTRAGKPCVVGKFIGAGGQGEVYEANYGTETHALKWYFPQSATSEQLVALEALVAKGPPSDRFLWPQAVVERKEQGFGYLMPLRSRRFKSLTDLVAGRIDPKFMALTIAGLELTKAFRSLHSSGWCYRDISFGNAFFDPRTGDVAICDNDNVCPEGTQTTGVWGTPDFLAPELVRYDNGARPGTKSDLHSLAVLLFYLFHIGHPLQGKAILKVRCWDSPAREKLFGREPLFIFDPRNKANEAIDDPTADPYGEAGRVAMIYWNTVYPATLQRTFVKAFTKGLKDPDERVTEREWLTTLAELHASLFYCQCGKFNFYDRDYVKATNGSPRPCWHCSKQPTLPYRLRVGTKSVVMLNSDSRIFPHHLGDRREFDLSSPVGEVSRHPTNPDVWGLRNLTKEKWIATLPDGTMRDVEQGRSAPLLDRVKISFGRVDGEIRY